MADGRLKCVGSSFFLKKRFGAGYHLICVKGVGCKSQEVTNLLRKYLPKIAIAADIGTELSYHLADDETGFFEQMFEDLESNMQTLHLSSFGVSLTTLEDVFHKVGKDASNTKLEAIGNGETKYDIENAVHSEIGTVKLLRGFALIRNQWLAMFQKKIIYWKRNWIAQAIPTVFAFVILLIPLLWMAADPKKRNVNASDSLSFKLSNSPQCANRLRYLCFIIFFLTEW